MLLHRLLERAAERTPAAPAVTDGSRTIDYASLRAEAGRVAASLRAEGVAPGDRVGLVADKSIEAVVGLYGVLLAGAAYVPVDASAPALRSGSILADAGARVIVTTHSRFAHVASLRPHAPGVDVAVVLGGQVDELGAGRAPLRAVAPNESPLLVGADVSPDDLAYVLYTSGSTGRPKGVMLSHANALAFVDWAVAAIGVDASDVVASHAPFHFDLSIFDLYVAASVGARLALVPAAASRFPVEVRRFIEAEQVTVWYSVPSILTMLVLRGGLTEGSLPSLRAILFAGEVFPTKYLRELMALCPQAAFWNLYGPTETNVCTALRVDALPSGDEQIPIGRAIAGVETFVVGEGGTILAAGEVGELLVVGPTVMLGYWNDVERTQQRLVPDPRPGRDGVAYATGDLVRDDGTGCYAFLGRRDAQVKSRGYRIELGEVEAALVAHPAVVEAVAVAIPDEQFTNRLAAFVTCRDDLAPAELTRFCASRVPRYMVPEHLFFRDDLPKTSTGKLDRQALLAEAISTGGKHS